MSERLAGVIEITMGQSPAGDACNVQGNGIPLLNGPTEFGPHHPSPVQYTTDPRKFSEPGDILFCVRGSTTGRMNWSDQRYAIGRGVAAIRHRSGQHFQPLLRACIEWQLPTLLASSTGSTFPNVTASMIGELQAPQLGPDALRVAGLVGQLDDKIELNRRLNETLEAMAQAIFRDWFIDFGPTRRKMEGATDPVEIMGGIITNVFEAETYSSAFPGSWANSELDSIPDGWEEGNFGELISQRNARVGKRPVEILSAVAEGKLVRSADYFKKRVHSINTEKYLSVEQWDFAYNPARINIGSVGMLREPIYGGVSPVYVVARPKEQYRWFLAYQLTLPKIKEWIATLCSGSVRQSLSYSDFSSIPIVIPPEGVAQNFNQIWTAFWTLITHRDAENQTLAAMRDLLLPKLMSGEIRLKDAEKIAEAAE